MDNLSTTTSKSYLKRSKEIGWECILDKLELHTEVVDYTKKMAVESNLTPATFLTLMMQFSMLLWNSLDYLVGKIEFLL